jgi:hypothetical protein
MPKSALIYAWAVIATGVAVLACAVVGWQSSDRGAFIVGLGLVAMAATFKMKLPKLTGTLSPAFVFVLVSVATETWSETVIIAALSAAVQCLWRPKTRPTALQLAFNMAALAIAGGVAHGMTQLLVVRSNPDLLLVALGAAGVALLVTNTLLLSTILCLVREAPFMTIWCSVQMWTVPYYLAGGVLANIWARAQLSPATGGVVLALASVYVLSICYRELSFVIGPG